MDVAIHINPSLSHQVGHGVVLKKGFERHGLVAEVTSDPRLQADMHVVSGPHYAKRYWLDHPRTILLDHCYYRGNPEHVSLGWMERDGSRLFRAGSGRQPPVVKDRRTEGGSIFLADYDGPVCHADTIRLHPARIRPRNGLIEVLRRHSLAIGFTTTALVTAALEGLEIDCRDSRNIMSQPNWLELLPYADWHHSEIESGELWEHLKS